MKRVSLLSLGRSSFPTGSPGPPPTLERRLRVRLHRRRLDRQLAGGFPSDAFEDRALRASQLTDAVTRRRVARTLRRLVKDVEHPAGMLGSAVPLSRRTVWPWRYGLLGLADRLERPGPINPCGVARTLELLTDGAGPLYSSRAERSVGDTLWWIADGLQSAEDPASRRPT